MDKLNGFLAEYYYTGIYGPIALIIVIVSLFMFVIVIHGRQQEKQKKKEIKKEIEKLESNNMEMDVEQFFKIRSQIIGQPPVKEYADRFDCTGMYILHNKTNDRYYVGQSENVLRRVNQHFSGSGGNADVYADYKYGNEWTIRIVPLQDSGFNRLNALEKYGIQLYNAYHNGYNKTRGNK